MFFFYIFIPFSLLLNPGFSSSGTDSSSESDQDSTDSAEEAEPDAMEEAVMEVIEQHGRPDFDHSDELNDVDLTNFVDNLKSTVEDVLDHASMNGHENLIRFNLHTKFSSFSFS